VLVDADVLLYAIDETASSTPGPVTAEAAVAAGGADPDEGADEAKES